MSLSQLAAGPRPLFPYSYGLAKHARYLFLDELRGLALLNMILFHVCWNVEALLDIPLPWYHTFGAHAWQLYICGSFLLLAGLCLHYTQHLFRHILTLAVCSALITFATWLAGSETLVTFGILHCMTLCFLCYVVLRPLLRRIPAGLGLFITLLLFAFTYHIAQRYLGLGPFQIPLPDAWYTSYWLSPLGLRAPGFHSSDYFPFFPYIFLFLAGYFLGKFSLPDWMRKSRSRPLAWLGQHSLIIYLLHQPILYGIMMPFFPE